MDDMLIERKLRLITPLLAAKRSNNPAAPRRVFVHERKVPKGEVGGKEVFLSSDLKRWSWAFLEARDACRFDDICLGCVLPSHWYATKQTSTFNRRFKRGNEPATEQFESISAGSIIRINFTLSRHLPPNTDGNGRFTRAPDETEFDAMLAFIGEHLGISEWGHDYKMGRFEIRPPHTTDDTTNEREYDRSASSDYADVDDSGTE